MTKIAIVHDYLTQMGGAERVALALAQSFPDAPIYTSVYEPKTTFPELGDHDIRPSGLQRLLPKAKFRIGAPLFGRAFEKFDLSSYDAVLVSTSGFAHHIKHPNALVYCHTPPHFLYELPQYLPNGFARSCVKPYLPILRNKDQRAAERHSDYKANSHRTAKQIADVYGKTADVLYPPLATSHLPASVALQSKHDVRALVVARLLPYKRVDVAIRACEQAGIPLTVVGQGPEEGKLRSIAGPTIRFMGRLGDTELAETFACHSFALMKGIEDFGFAPIDANYAGLPIVAVNAGGAKETVKDGETGVLVDGYDIDDWVLAIERVLATKWSPSSLRRSTQPFQLEAFQGSVRRWVDESVTVDVREATSPTNSPHDHSTVSRHSW